MSRNIMEDFLEWICDELETLHEEVKKKGKLDTSTLNQLDAMVDVKKDILEVMGMEEYLDNKSNEYSNTRNSYSNGRMNSNSYNNGNRYMNMNMNNGYSGHGYNRGYYIQPYYMENRGGMGMPYNNYGYSRDMSEQEMIQQLRDMASNANPQKKDAIHSFLEQLEQMS